MRQYCENCDKEVCRLKNGVDFKVRCEHYTMNDSNSIDIRSKAMCAVCFNKKSRGWQKYKKGKHFNERGTLLKDDNWHKKLLKELEQKAIDQTWDKWVNQAVCNISNHAVGASLGQGRFAK